MNGAWMQVLCAKGKKMTNRKIVHDIKGKLSPSYSLAQLIAECKHSENEQINGMCVSMAKQAVVLIPQILELLDQIEDKD